MHNSLEFIAKHLPRVTVDEVVRRFSSSVAIRDAQAFAAELQTFIHERVEAVELPGTLEVRIDEESPEQTMARKAAGLRAQTRWAPGETDVQRGHTLTRCSLEGHAGLALSLRTHQMA